jgi:predicted ATPase
MSIGLSDKATTAIRPLFCPQNHEACHRARRFVSCVDCESVPVESSQMQIKRFRLLNYKSFRDSGWLTFSSAFTVVVGKNNVGKTALLESLRITSLAAKPHRNASIDFGVILDPRSVAQAEVLTSGVELKNIQCEANVGIHLPIPVDSAKQDQGAIFCDAFYAAKDLTIRVRSRSGESLSSSKYPSHSLFAAETNKFDVAAKPTADRQSIKFTEAQSTGNDSVPALVQQGWAKSVYVFRAERLSIGRTGIANTSELRPDGSNLAAVLLMLQSNNARFERFNRHVSEIFPTIRRLSVVPVENNHVEVRVWSVDPETERTDLAISLEESGTGVGQVLAILYVVMTVERGTIVIDEPNSFLHPGAAKKLIQILRQYNHHQFILATHSGDLIATADPETIQLVTWTDGESRVQEVDKKQINYLREILLEVGASFSDFFGFDRAVWVEGPTEETCFPIILDKLRRQKQLGLVFLAVRNTGDFEGRGNQKKLVWDIYKKLTTGMSLLPSMVSFSFDREHRSQKDIDDLDRESQGQVKFLPRLCYENYLLDSEAIAAILNSTPREGLSPASASDVDAWLAKNGGKFIARWSSELSDPLWLSNVNAAKLLTCLFDELSGTNLEYRKTTHSLLLTEWILEHKPHLFKELAEYIESLAVSTSAAQVDQRGKLSDGSA